MNEVGLDEEWRIGRERTFIGKTCLRDVPFFVASLQSSSDTETRDKVRADPA